MGHSIHSVWHFTRELAEDLTHADSRVWRTLVALISQPGFLTFEFLAERRARYLPPLRLYLVLSVFFFVAATSAHLHSHIAVVKTDKGKPTTVTVETTNSAPELRPRPGETRQQTAERICHSSYNGIWHGAINEFLVISCRTAILVEEQTLTEAFVHNLPRAMFIFLPVFALTMYVLYLGQHRYYVEHLLYLLHNHALVFLAFGSYLLLTRLTWSWLASCLAIVLAIYLTYYLFRSMRVVYGQGPVLTLAKFLLLLSVYCFCAILIDALTGVYTVMTL